MVAHGVREEMTEIAGVMVGYAAAVGDDAAAEQFRAEIVDLRSGGAVQVAWGWQVGHPDPNSGPFWLEADDRISEVSP